MVLSHIVTHSILFALAVNGYLFIMSVVFLIGDFSLPLLVH